GAAQVLLMVVLLAGTALLSLCGVLGIAWLTAGLFALVALAIVMNSVFVVPWVVRRQLEIRFQEGVWPQAPPDATRATDRAAALRQAWKQNLPGLLMLAVCCAFLPWRKNWLGCLGYLAVPALCVLWSARRRYRQVLGQANPTRLRSQVFLKHPLLMMAAAAFLVCLLALVLSNLGVRYLAWLNTGTLPDLPLVPPYTRQLLFGLLIAVIVFALGAVAARKFLPVWPGLGGKLKLPFLDQMQAAARGPEAILETAYRPLFEQLNLAPDRARPLKDLLLKRTMVGVRAGMPLMNPLLKGEKRAQLIRTIQADLDACIAQIRELLGDGFARFQEFEKSLPDRTLLDQLRGQTDHTPLALTEDQRLRLLETMLEARRRYPWTSDLARHNQTLSLTAVYTPASVDTFTREQADFDRQFLDQARQILSAEQFAVFEKLQTRRRESQTSQFKMGIRLFGG
ncbi:MAG TPA: hypothetical protein VNT26_15440, partial [Candidatus Sulfotelmatobacter sp.]|nr:hypothetical protein [Candidatus Sulfotelmatobacter sp.]